MRIVITPGHFADLALGETISYWVAGHQVEVTLAPELTRELQAPPDPPQAREFLPARKKRK